MATPIFADRVQETFTTTGTGTLTLAGAVTGYQAFGTALTTGQTCYYAATDGTNWEVGLGTYTTSGNTFARTTIIASSNANSAVNWAAGTKNIWLDFPAVAATPNIYQATPSNPTGTTSTTAVMMGLAGAFTPKVTGTIFVMITGDVQNSSASANTGSRFQLSYGTSTAPTNGAALAGTQIGSAPQYATSTASMGGLEIPFTIAAVITGLTLNTAYWLDTTLFSITAGTSTMKNVNICAYEIM